MAGPEGTGHHVQRFRQLFGELVQPPVLKIEQEQENTDDRDNRKTGGQEILPGKNIGNRENGYRCHKGIKKKIGQGDFEPGMIEQPFDFLQRGKAREQSVKGRGLLDDFRPQVIRHVQVGR